MEPQIKRSAVLPSEKGLAGMEQGKQISTSGIWLAIILDALRKAEDNDIERQQQQAQAEQAFEQVLGNVGGDPTKGIIAQQAQNLVEQGKEQGAGLMAAGIAMAVGAGLTLAVTAGMCYKAFGHMSNSNTIQKEMDGVQNDLDNLNEPSNADLVLAGEGKSVDASMEREMDDLAKGTSSDTESEPATEAIKVDNQDKLAEARAAKEKQIENKQKKQQDEEKVIDRLMQGNNTISQIASSAAGSAQSYGKAGHDIDAAKAGATAEVLKTVQQVDSSNASSFQQHAAESARDARETASSLSQIAAAQVQVPA